jgi:hypothetical protein
VGSSVRIKSAEKLQAIFQDSNSYWTQTIGPRLRAAGKVGNVAECDASDFTLKVKFEGQASIKHRFSGTREHAYVLPFTGRWHMLAFIPA